MDNKMLRSGLALLILSLTAACTSAALDDESRLQQRMQDQAKMSAKKDLVYGKMSSVIGAARCEVDTQCASMPVGNSSCGGPAHYLVYSTMIGDDLVKELTALSNETKELDMQMAKLQKPGAGMMGVCRYMTPGDVACVDNVCKQH